MIYLVLIVISSGIFNAGISYILAFMAITVGYQLFKKRDISLNFLQKPEFWMLLVFGIMYVIFDELTITNIINYVLLIILAYIVGWSCIDSSDNPLETIQNCILSISGGIGIHIVLNYLTNIGNNRYALTDFWTGSYRAATGSGFLNTFLIILILHTLIFEKRLWVKLIMLILTAVSILYMFMLGTRTQFIILFAVLLVGVSLYKYETDGVRGLAKSSAIAIACIVLFTAAYYINIFGFGDFVKSSNIAARYYDDVGLSHSNSDRFEAFYSGMRDLFLYPLGGLKNEPFRHNLWLDIGRVSGIFPFVLMLAYSIITVYHMFKIFADKDFPQHIRYMLFCVYLGIMINLSVEPVLEGMLDFFLLFCVIGSMTDCIYYKLAAPYGYKELRKRESKLGNDK